MRYVKKMTIAMVILTFTLIFFTACNQAAPGQLITSTSDKGASSLPTAAKPASTPGATPAADNVTAVNNPALLPLSRAGPPVQIIEVHARGTLSPMSCCNPDLIERDEFVAIRNTTTSPQDIRGWTLKNITRGYPTFTFPNNFPCVAYNVPPASYPAVPGGYNTFREITPQTVDHAYTIGHQGPGPVYSQDQIDWSQCGSSIPLDDSPLKPAAGQQGSMSLCILYPGQTVLVFTDEIHCQYGGLSFNYGTGDIWDDAYTDIAVLYDAQGHEVSRKGYATGK
ncbi:MAG: lamin tail domain-containing protein [Dehalococcoidia bacterium]